MRNSKGRSFNVRPCKLPVNKLSTSIYHSIKCNIQITMLRAHGNPKKGHTFRWNWFNPDLETDINWRYTLIKYPHWKAQQDSSSTPSLLECKKWLGNRSGKHHSFKDWVLYQRERSARAPGKRVGWERHYFSFLGNKTLDRPWEIFHILRMESKTLFFYSHFSPTKMLTSRINLLSLNLLFSMLKFDNSSVIFSFLTIWYRL